MNQAKAKLPPFTWLCFLIVFAGSSVFCGMIGWLLWCITNGSVYNLVFCSITSSVLLIIMVVSQSTFVIIALEGRRSMKKPEIHAPAQLEVKRVTLKEADVNQWLIPSPINRPVFINELKKDLK